MPGKKGNKGGGGGGAGGKKPDQPKAAESAPEAPFKFNFGGNVQGETRIPTFDFGGKDSPLIPMMQKKLNNLIGKASGYFESLPAPVQERIKGLKGLHRQKAELDRQYKKELLELQAKFDKLIDPLYARRKEIVTGASEPSNKELEEAAKFEAEKAANEEKTEEKEEEKKEEKKGEEVKTEKQEEEEPADVKGIPNFWLSALQHHGDFAESITKQDEKALKYLLDVRWKPLPEEKGRSEASFVLEFEFSENPYFTDKVLTKTYYLTEHELLGETMFDKMEGFNINWKPGKDLTVKLVQVQQNIGRRGGRRGRGGKGKGGGGKTITVEEPTESFFNFFKSDVASAFMVPDDEEDVDLQDLYEADYEMGVAIKEQIIPSAVLWFTGEIEDPWGEEDEGEDEDEDGEYDSAEDPDFEAGPEGQPGQKPECADRKSVV